MTTTKEKYMTLAKQIEHELFLEKSKALENYCQKIIDDLVKEIWKNEKNYLKKFKNMILEKREPKFYIKSIPARHYDFNETLTHYEIRIKKPNSFFGYYVFKDITSIKNQLNKLICDQKLPKDFILDVEDRKTYELRICLTLR